MFKNCKLFKRIVSGMAAAVMMATNSLPFIPVNVAAEDVPVAHTINVFDIDLKAGADYYSTYTPDDPSGTGSSSLNSVYVWQADSSNAGHKFVYNIKLSISGEGTTDIANPTADEKEAMEAVGEGFIEIRIPAHILKYKGDTAITADSSGLYPDEAELPVPNVTQMSYKEIDGQKVYDTDHQFVYRYEDNDTPDDESDDYYVIYNIKPVSAGVVYEFPVAYIMSKNTWEYQDLGASAPFKAKVEINSWEKRNNNTGQIVPKSLEQTTREIPVYVDTGAKITNTVKKADAVLIDAAEAKKKMGLADDLDSSYKYVVWSVSSDISDVTQRYSLNLTDVTSDLTGKDVTIAGAVEAVKMGSQIFQGSAISNCELTGLTASGKRTDYILTRYKKSDVEDLENHSKPAVYTASNDVTVRLTPADRQDNSTEKHGNAAFKYEVKDPVWLPLEVGFTSNKWGLYNNGKSRVTNKTNISSYAMKDLTTDGETVSGLQYETKSTAHAYGKTIADLNNEITALATSDNDDGTVTVTAGGRIYVFDTSDAETYTMNGAVQTVSGSYPTPLSLLNIQRIVAQDIADHYYGQKSLDYIFDDKTFSLSNVNDPSAVTPLGKNDYKIDSVKYEYLVRQYVYDANNMEFSAGTDNDYINDDSQNILEFYVYNDGAETPVPVGSYNILTGTPTITDSTLVSSLTADGITFAEGANITGYQIKTSNKYFYVELKTIPSITLKASTNVKPIVKVIVDNPTTKEQKIAVNNTCNWTVKNDSTELLNTDRTGTDYIADIIRKSSISKKALGEKTNITGQDGKTYRSRNDTLAGQYELAWQTRISETADGVEVNGELANNVPVAQQSGIFYDLLPSHSDIIEGSVNVYVDASGDVNEGTTALAPSSFEVLDRIDDYNGSGKKLLVIKINAPCNSSYTVTYVTVHSHEDIQDYGSFALNTVAYQTGNADIGDGYPDNGGNYAVSMSAYIKGLDPDNGTAKRFIYAEATEDILALFPTSSGIYKKVATQNDPTYRKTGVVHNGETYTYSIRMQNDSSTKAKDIAILDSVENYRTVKGAAKAINSGLDHDRDWNGTIVSFDLQGIEDKMGETYKNDLKLILYKGSDPVNLDDEQYSDVGDRKYILYKILGLESKASTAATNAGLTNAQIAEFDSVAKRWVVADNWKAPTNVDLSDVTAFIVYTGESFILPKGKSLSFTVKMKAPDNVAIDKTADPENGVFLETPKTYNNIYRSFTSSQDTTNVDTYFYTHYDYTQVEYSTVGTVKFSKRDSETNETIPNVTFNLSGISDYGTVYNETLISDGNGIVTFKNLERGTYQLIESTSDEDHLLDTEPRTIMVDPQGVFTFVKMDGTPMVTLDTDGKVVVNGSDDEDIDIDANGNFSLKNDPRYHGDLTFRKTDALSGEGISGTKFTLSGTSIYNTVYNNIEAESDANGNVVFENIEKGSYKLTETVVSDGYLPPVNKVYEVTSTGTRDLVFKITGENAVNAGTEYQIRNTPTAEMTLQKVDSITKNTLDDAQFTLTADSTVGSLLDTVIPKLTAQGISTSWVNNSGTWVQTVNGSISAGTGRYVFSYLPEGTYTLKETTPPTHYEANSTVYTIKVIKSTDGKKLVIELPSGKSEWEYIRLENGEFTTATADTALYQRLNNNETYDDGKTVVKSWVGGVDGSFPSMHLSTEKPEVVATKVTIDKTALRTMLTSDSSNVTSFTKSDSPPPSTATDAKDTTFTDETGNFKIWKDGKTVYWWSDADIIYLPRDCKDLFKDCSNLTSLDLSSFYVDKVTTFESAFSGCTKLATITFNNESGDNFANGTNITSLKSMFNDCNALKSVDLQYLVTSGIDEVDSSKRLTDISSMFKDCRVIESIKVTSLNTSAVTDMSNTFDLSDHLSGGAGLNGSDKLKELDIRNFETSNVTSFYAMFAYCRGLETIKLDNTKFIAGDKVTCVSRMFERNYALRSIDLSGFGNCPNIGNTNYNDIGDSAGMQFMFRQCWGLECIDLSNFKPGSTTTTTYVFHEIAKNISSKGCIIYGINWNKSNANTFYNSYIRNGDTGALVANNSGTKAATYCKPISEGGYFTTKTSTTSTSSFSSKDTSRELNTISDSTTAGASSITFPNYPNFDKTGTVTQTENTSATADDVGATSFTFEYVTEKTAVPTSGTAPYEVDETIYLIVSKIVEDNGAYYTVSQKYEYDGTAKAKWTEVGGSAPTQWKCEMQVFDADDEFFAWEDKVTGYTSTADKNNPIKTVGSSDKPVITNAKNGTPVGDLELSKLLTDEKQKYSKDKFTFKVTMWKESAKTNKYTMLPFNSDGVAYFDVIPNAADDDKIVIKGIPAGCVYEVEEVGLNGKTSGLNGEYTASPTTAITGTITANNTEKAEIVNEINTVDLSLTKNAVLKKNTADAPDTYTEADPSDADYIKWKKENFTFVVTFENLVVGQKYSYTIDNTPQYVVVNGSPVEDKIVGNDKSAETVKTLTIKGGQVVEFKDIPIGTKYTIVETSDFADTEGITYTTENNKGTLKSTGKQTLSATDAVTFTNTQQIDETLIPEYVEVTVNKKWYSQDGLEVEWLQNEAGKAVKFRWDDTAGKFVEDDENGSYIPYTSNDGGATKEYLTNYPSFLKVYLGRAMAVPREETEGGVPVTKYTYLDVVPGYTSASLNVKGGWSSTFSDLEKYGEIMEYNDVSKEYEKKRYPYVYFVSEVVPIGFSNTNTETKTKIGDGEYFVTTGSDNRFEFTFTNQEDATCALSICKLVTGNFGNKAKDFTFEVEFTKSDGTALVGTGFTMQFTDLHDDSYVRNRTYTLENGKLNVDIPYGKKVTFLSLPTNTSYKITELNGDGYEIHSGTYSGNAVSIDVDTLTGGSVQQGTLSADTSYLYVNDLSGSVPTGIKLAVTATTIVFILISCGTLYLLILRRKEKATQ